MLPKKHTKNRRSVPQNRVTFDRGRPLKRDIEKNRNKRRAFFGVIFRSMSLILGFSVVISGIYAFMKVRAFDQNLENTVNQLKGNCKKYDRERPLNSYLFIGIDINKKIHEADFVVYDRERLYVMKFKEVEFRIDKGGTRGTLQNYIDSNNIFIDEDSILANLSNLFLREFKLKVDHIVVGEDGYRIEDFINKRNQPIPTKIRALKKPFDTFIKTDICRESWNTFVSDFTDSSRMKKNIMYSANTKIADLFFFSDLKKEQVRIHLTNKTGVDQWGRFTTTLFENYGLHVVKVDMPNETSTTSKIYIDEESLRNSATLRQIKYLTDNLVTDPGVDNKVSIFSDVGMEIGQDLLIP